MRKPVNDWHLWYDAQPFGSKTDYGYHDGSDINLKTGGDSDLGQPLYAIADGVVTSTHFHSTSNNYGKHLHIKHTGPWGTVWSHYAHCSEILAIDGQEVKEGDLIGRVGKSGTVYSHLHFAIKLEPTGVDAIAKTLDDLKKWTDPIKFIEKWEKSTIIDIAIPEKTYNEEEMTKMRLERDKNWKLYQDEVESRKTDIEKISVKIGCSNSLEAILARIESLNKLDSQLEDARSEALKQQEVHEQEKADLQRQITELKQEVEKQQLENTKLLERLDRLEAQVVDTTERKAFLDRILKWLRL